MDNLLMMWKPSAVAAKVLQLPEPFIRQWLPSCNQRLDLQHSDVPASKILKLLKYMAPKDGKSNTDLSVLHLPAKAVERASPHETECVGGTGRGTFRTAELDCARYSWASIAQCAPSSVHQHLLCDALAAAGPCVECEFSNKEEGMQFLYGAIGGLRKLKQLAIPEWVRFLDKSMSALQPLTRLEGPTVSVNDTPPAAHVAAVAAVVPRLSFSTVPVSKSSFA